MEPENEETPDLSKLAEAYQAATKAWSECRHQIALLQEQEQCLLKEKDESYRIWFEARRQ